MLRKRKALKVKRYMAMTIVKNMFTTTVSVSLHVTLNGHCY